MGQKVHPVGFRLGIVKPWNSCWYAEGREYGQSLVEDIRIRNFIKRRMYHAGVARIEIERSGSKLRINVFAARPGIIIGRKGAEIENLRQELAKFTDKQLQINIYEVDHPDMSAQLLAENVASQLERRVSFRRAMKRCVSMAMRAGAQGVKIRCAGRLGGADIARAEWYREGRVPLNTLRADIDYGFAEAHTIYGLIGVKVWVFKGEVLGGC